jgi:hypothetical protein
MEVYFSEDSDGSICIVALRSAAIARSIESVIISLQKFAVEKIGQM